MKENINTLKDLFDNLNTTSLENNALKSRLKKLEEELKIVKIQAEESTHVKTTLLSSLSHEFRTPMNGIMGFAELLKENLTEIELISMVNNILQSGNRLMSTLNSIQFLAELEADTIRKEFQTIHVNTFLLGNLGEFETIATQKNIYLKTLFKNWRLSTTADPNLLRIALKTLLDNAVKFTEKGGITIETGNTIIKGQHLAYISIKDTGIGISESYLQKIFEPFRQQSEGWGRIYEGSGLGLPICIKIISKLNGSLQVKSDPGKGSVFTILLPLTEEQSATQSDTPWKSIHETMDKETDKNNKGAIPLVLIVEDNSVNKELMIVFLKKTCRTEYAIDGETAVKMAAQKQYSCILMDINLGPGIDGLEATRRIRELPGYKNIPIIAVTGYTLNGDRERLLDCGCSHYLPKPFDRRSIVNLVEDVLYPDNTN
ncbi:MAG: hybrid sensor histidine kinase/response regulator [Bacteroidales bacterium]